ncbi:MAG: hypothetical protein V3V10_04070 [Planctomycetota bacterium]
MVFTKNHCTGLELLIIKDETESKAYKPDLEIARFKSGPNVLSGQWFASGETLCATNSDGLKFEGDDGIWHVFTQPGPCFVEYGWTSFPASVPGELTISQQLLDEHESKKSTVTITSNDDDADLSCHLRHESGAVLHFTGHGEIPRGKYLLTIFDFSDYEKPRYAELELSVSADLSIDETELEWNPLTKVTVRLSSLGDAINGWPRWGGLDRGLQLVNKNRNQQLQYFGESVMRYGWEVLSEREFWLPPGRYLLDPWFGVDETEVIEFQVFAGKPVTVTVGS